jgi:hypothetical protein
MKKLLILLFSFLLLSSPSVIADVSLTSELTNLEKEEQKSIDNAIFEESILRAKNNPGFRDLKPGIPRELYKKYCEKDKNDTSYDICYGIDDIKFNDKNRKERKSSIGVSKRGVWLLQTLILDMGPIVSSDGSFFSTLNNLVASSNDEPNIYLKMKKNFDAKYVLDYEYSERDRQLFNEEEKEELLGVYSNGQVVLKINRKERENSYSKDLWLFIEYRDVKYGKQFLEKNRPVTATLDDF